MQVFAQAAEKAKSTQLDAITKVLKSEKFDTVLGSVGFDQKGDVNAPGYVVYEWKDGKYDYVAP
jgi:branched-chain amino acid transport system substrate-binding protein